MAHLRLNTKLIFNPLDLAPADSVASVNIRYFCCQNNRVKTLLFFVFFCHYTTIQIMSYDELKEYLGVEPESPCALPRPTFPEPSLEDAVSSPSSPESPFEDCLGEQLNTHQLYSDAALSTGASDTGGSAEDSTGESSRSECSNKRNSHSTTALQTESSHKRCNSGPVSTDGGLLSDETLEDMMEIEVYDNAVRSHSLFEVDHHPNSLGSLHTNSGVHLGRLHQSCPAPFSSPMCEAVPSMSYSFRSLSKVSVKSKTPCPTAAVKPRGIKGRSREPLKSLDNFSFVAMSPATSNRKLKQSVQSMCISRKGSPTIPML